MMQTMLFPKGYPFGMDYCVAHAYTLNSQKAEAAQAASIQEETVENGRTTFNAICCCVSRDSLDLMKDRCTVLRYNAFVSPWTMLSGEKVEVSSEKLENAYAQRKFYVRCMQHDAQLSTMHYIRECGSDWFMLDLADARLGINFWKDSNVYMTRSIGFRRVIGVFEEILGKVYDAFYPWEFPDEILWPRLDALLDIILEMYRPEQIIFHEIYGIEFYMNMDRCIRKWKKSWTAYIQSYNAFLKKVYDHALGKLHGCHIIRFPENVLPYEGNRWGLHELHFHGLYYEYASKAISVVLDRHDRDAEEKELAVLHELYSQKFATLKAEAERNTLREDYESRLQQQEDLAAKDADALKAGAEGLSNELMKSSARETELNDMVRKLRVQEEILDSKVDSLSRQLKAVTNSRSYKLGRAVTYIPRKIRDVFRKKR